LLQLFLQFLFVNVNRRYQMDALLHG
jgi:hypothetical protein